MIAEIHIVGTHSSNHGGLDGSRIGRCDRKRYGESVVDCSQTTLSKKRPNRGWDMGISAVGTEYECEHSVRLLARIRPPGYPRKVLLHESGLLGSGDPALFLVFGWLGGFQGK